MTGYKRFYLLNYKNNPIYDSLENKEYNARYKKQREELCKLLNELNDTEPQKIEVIKELQPRYSEGTSAKWYYNTDNNITDGEEEYTIHRKEQVTYLDGTILHGINDLLDQLNKYEEKIFQLKEKNEQLKERITNKNIETEIEIGRYIEKVLKVIDEENEKYWLKEKTSLRKEAKIYNSFRRSLTKIGRELFS